MFALKGLLPRLLIACFLMVTAACQTTQTTISDDQYLSSAEMLEFTNNKKYSGISQPNGIGFQALIKNDGTIEGSSGSSVDSGIWRLDGNAACIKWNNWRYAEEYCVRVIKRPDGRFASFYLDGAKSSVYSLQ